MMGHHLYVVLPSSLSIENQDLVHVECGLSEIIEFNWSSERDVGITKPKITWVKYTSRKIDMDILLKQNRTKHNHPNEEIFFFKKKKKRYAQCQMIIEGYNILPTNPVRQT